MINTVRLMDVAKCAFIMEEKMDQFKIGQLVGIPCDVGNGPFDGEALVTFQTIEGPVSGFVSEDDLKDKSDGFGILQGLVVEIGDDRVTVRVRGSFFTTTGIAYFSPETVLPLDAVA